MVFSIDSHLRNALFFSTCTIGILSMPTTTHAQSLSDELRLCLENTSTNTFGYAKRKSDFTVEETVERLEFEITNRGLNIFGIVNHQANAANVGIEMPPNQLIIFGNPNIGSSLMSSNPSIGLDLPQKFLVWTVSNGDTCIAYNQPDYLRIKHNLFGQDAVIQKVEGALNAIIEAATLDDSLGEESSDR